MTFAPTFRSATDADIDGVAALIGDRIGSGDAEEARLVLQDDSFDRQRWTVAVDGDAVVSTMASFPAELTVSGVSIPAAMIEFVATAAGFEGRGLVRRQFDIHHAASETASELVQFIVGIPYFYRRFGYELAVPMAGYHHVDGAKVDQPDGLTNRDATDADLPAIDALQRLAASHAEVHLLATEHMWRWYLASPEHTVRVAVRDGEVVAVWRITADDGPIVLDLAARDDAGRLAAMADVGGKAMVATRSANAEFLDSFGTHEPTTEAFYVRIGDPAAYLRALRPALESRIAASDIAGASGEVLLSFYAASVTLDVDEGRIADVRWGSGVPAPVSAGGSGIPPDHFVALALGPLSVAELDQRHPDLYPGWQRELLDVLFPPLTSDVASWVAP